MEIRFSAENLALAPTGLTLGGKRKRVRPLWRTGPVQSSTCGFTCWEPGCTEPQLRALLAASHGDACQEGPAALSGVMTTGRHTFRGGSERPELFVRGPVRSPFSARHTAPVLRPRAPSHVCPTAAVRVADCTQRWRFTSHDRSRVHDRDLAGQHTGGRFRMSLTARLAPTRP